MFNSGQYVERAARGELNEVVLVDRHPSASKAKEPVCTRSQLVAYKDPKTGYTLAKAHRYLRQDGTIGASGKPDPKTLKEKGQFYALEHP